MSIINTYIGPVRAAVLVFPLLALLLSFPYIIYEYRHYGSIPFLRTVIVYTFILYLINLYFQVILPLPARSSVTASTVQALQLQPLHFLRQIWASVSVSLHSPRTWISALRNEAVYQAVLNVLLFFPLGVYLHYYFRRGLFSTILLCFAGSLFCELTQLSGLYGIYPYPYRTFDVDDLILNTCGGFAGWCLSPLICLILPSRDRIDGTAYERGNAIPLLRRFLAFAVDFALISLVQSLFSLFLPDSAAGEGIGLVLSLVLTLVYFIGMTTVTDGYTVGKWLFRLRLSDEDGGSPTTGQYLIRYLFLTLLVIHLPSYYIIGGEMMQATEGALFYFWKNLRTLSEILGAVFVIEFLVRLFTGSRVFFYERLSQTRNENMVREK